MAHFRGWERVLAIWCQSVTRSILSIAARRSSSKWADIKSKPSRGLIVTHCHDDHKRWFTDLALFINMRPMSPGKYSSSRQKKLTKNFSRGRYPAIDRSLSHDSKSIVDISYGDYINHQLIGPGAKYKIIPRNEGMDGRALCIG